MPGFRRLSGVNEAERWRRARVGYRSRVGPEGIRTFREPQSIHHGGGVSVARRVGGGGGPVRHHDRHGPAVARPGRLGAPEAESVW